MQGLNVKHWGCIGLLIGLAIIMGCSGGSDLLDETGYRYQISIATPKDRGVETSDLDIWYTCDNSYFNGPEDEDPLTKSVVSLTFRSAKEQPDIWVYRFKLEFDLIEQVGYPDNTAAIPTSTFDEDIFIPGNGGTSSADIDLLTITDKIAYMALVGFGNNGVLTDAVFQVHVTAYLTVSPESPHTTLEITRDFTINVGNFADKSCD